jgi:hypothetical protein
MYRSIELRRHQKTGQPNQAAPPARGQRGTMRPDFERKRGGARDWGRGGVSQLDPFTGNSHANRRPVIRRCPGATGRRCQVLADHTPSRIARRRATACPRSTQLRREISYCCLAATACVTLPTDGRAACLVCRKPDGATIKRRQVSSRSTVRVRENGRAEESALPFRVKHSAT